MDIPNQNPSLSIYDLDLERLQILLTSWGEPGFRAKQIWQGIYKQFWSQPDQFSTLPANLRQKLAESITFSPLTPEKTLESLDRQTIKQLFLLKDQNAIETVLMRYEDRRTLCISSQAGCAMGCVFCATGQMGFKRHLTSGEIVAQVVWFAHQLHSQDEKVTNVVIMGMGEPFHNYDAVMSAINRLNHQDGMNLGERRFTISTVGLVPMIQRFSAEKRQINLAISLHSAEDELRSSMLPINKKYPISELLAACKEYTLQTGRRITFEWALIQGVNDSTLEATKLARLLKGLLCHVNVIPLNPTSKYSGQATTHQRAEAFKATLERAGIPCTIRIRRGIDIQAGCGQLATRAGEKTD